MRYYSILILVMVQGVVEPSGRATEWEVIVPTHKGNRTLHDSHLVPKITQLRRIVVIAIALFPLPWLLFFCMPY